MNDPMGSAGAETRVGDWMSSFEEETEPGEGEAGAELAWSAAEMAREIASGEEETRARVRRRREVLLMAPEASAALALPWPLPLVAAARGFLAGGGEGRLLVCQLRFAEPWAKLRTENRRRPRLRSSTCFLVPSCWR